MGNFLSSVGSNYSSYDVEKIDETVLWDSSSAFSEVKENAVFLLNAVPESKRAAVLQQKGRRDYTVLFSIVLHWGGLDLIAALLNVVPEKDRVAAVKDVLRNGDSMLHVAATEKNLALMTLLLNLIPENERAALVRHTNHNGESALHIAALYGEFEILAALLNAVPENERLEFIQQMDGAGRTAVYLAASWGQVDAVELMFSFMPKNERTAFLNQVNAAGETPLLWNVRENNLLMVQCLLRHGADINVVDAKGRNVFWHAKDAKMLELLLGTVAVDQRTAIVNQVNAAGETLLIENAREKNISMLQCLLRNGADVNAVDAKGRNACSYAVENKDAKMLEFLLGTIADDQRAAVVNQVNAAGETLLIENVREKNLSMVQCLLRSGADVNAVDAKGRNACWHAVENNDAKMLEFLLETVGEAQRAAVINQVNAAGETLLIEHVREEKFWMVESLLRRGADVNAVDAKGRNAFWHAFENKDAHILRLLLGEVDDGLRAAVVNGVNAAGEARLIENVREKKISMVQCLLRNGADVNAVDAKGRNVFWHAFENKDAKMLKLLLEAPIDDQRAANVNQVNAAGETPLIWSASEGDFLQVLRLLNHGANLNAVDALGRNALMRAQSNGHTNVINILGRLEFIASGNSKPAAQKEAQILQPDLKVAKVQAASNAPIAEKDDASEDQGGLWGWGKYFGWA